MRKIIDGWTEIGEGCSGRAYGHVPGHQYHDVDVTISTRGARVRVHVRETWGSAQGRDEEHGRREVAAIEATVGAACERAIDQARDAGIEDRYLVEAASEARDAAETREAVS